MLVLNIFLIAILAQIHCQKLGFVSAPDIQKTVCYYNSKSFYRLEQGYMQSKDLIDGIRYCTHLIYGFAKVDKEDHKVKPGNEDLDVKRDNYRTVTDLRMHNPRLNVLLSIGGYEDEDPQFYMEILEDTNNREKLVKSALKLVNEYKFDGLDLAWQFPKIKVSKNRSIIGSFWHSTKKVFGAGHYIDEKIDEHRDQFTALVRRFKDKLTGKLLTLTQLPNVNASSYYDIAVIHNYVDQVHLMAFDFHKSSRNKYIADYSNPVYPSDRNMYDNIDTIVRYWVHSKMPKGKLILIVPTHGNAWKITINTSPNGNPPLEAEGPLDETPITKTTGLLAFYEICQKITDNYPSKKTDVYMRRFPDYSKNTGPYAYRALRDSENYGIWVSYEEPESITNKKHYILSHGLGGIGLSDLSMDDFRGSCNLGRKFPLLKAASKEYVTAL